MNKKALIFVGSARVDSHTKALGIAIENSLKIQGISTTLIDLAEASLPNANPAFHRDPSQHTDIRIRTLADQATQSDMFVFLSPVYHNSYSAVLKNAFDNLAIAQFKGKVVGLGSHGGDRTTQAVDHLRIVARGLNALAIPTQVCTQESDFVENGKGFLLTEASILERIERFTNELVKIATALNG